MKTNLKVLLSLAFSLFTVLLFSCESWFDGSPGKEATYRYIIKNTTTSPVVATVEVNKQANVVVKGSPVTTYTIAPGNTAEVWATSGFTTDEVRDEEKDNQELYWISVSATSNGRQARYNLDSTTRWVYHKSSSRKASYTLALAEDDF